MNTLPTELELNTEELPETIDHTIETGITPDTHDWHQEGPYVVCNSCKHHHAVYVGVAKRMTGLDEEGNPILTDC